MQLILGVDIRTQIDIPYQKFECKLNVGVDEVVIVSENNEIEDLKHIKEIFLTYENEMLIKTSKTMYSFEVTEEIKTRYKNKKKIILAIIDKKKNPVALYQIIEVLLLLN